MDCAKMYRGATVGVWALIVTRRILSARPESRGMEREWECPLNRRNVSSGEIRAKLRTSFPVIDHLPVAPHCKTIRSGEACEFIRKGTI
ncbi:hypothetical protein DPEC_G00210450 [Dallia pectoralis]|uniref:Uncharacterized protein n=1 Tax=Dallia pectoralis TaxID=75939 RepID=A0ACC2G5E2_DALPE|nr:hypothetical protein DPEC_G00210450 [Dallia pectoralis]